MAPSGRSRASMAYRGVHQVTNFLVSNNQSPRWTGNRQDPGDTSIPTTGRLPHTQLPAQEVPAPQTQRPARSPCFPQRRYRRWGGRHLRSDGKPEARCGRQLGGHAAGVKDLLPGHRWRRRWGESADNGVPAIPERPRRPELPSRSLAKRRGRRRQP